MFKKTFFLTLLLSAQTFAAGTYIKGPALVEGLTAVTSAAGTTTLTKDSETIQHLTGSTTQTYTLPDATTLPLYRRFFFINKSTGTATINANGGGLVLSLSSGNQAEVLVTNVGSAAGTWIYGLQSSGGGATLPSLVQGDTLYASGTNTLAALAKDTNSTRYLSNTGTSNNPAWSQVNLTNGVTGTLPIANGGTNSTATPTLGGAGYGTGSAHAYTAAGSAGQVLISQAAAAPVWGTDVLGVATNSNANTGNKGEYVSSASDGQSNTCNGNSNWGDITSISLTAGDWDVTAAVTLTINNAVGWVYTQIGIGTASGNNSAGVGMGTTGSAGAAPTSNYNLNLSVPNVRISINSTTTYYFKIWCAYASNSPQYVGYRLTARRVR